MRPEIRHVESYPDLGPQEGLDLRQYWRVLSQYAWGLLGLVFVTGMVATVIVHTLEPVYRATVTLLIEATPSRVVSIEEVYGVSETDRKYYQTQYEILKSRTLAEKVVDRLSLWKQPEFDPTAERETKAPVKIPWRNYIPADWLPNMGSAQAMTDALRREIAVSRFTSRVSVLPLQDSQLVRVSVDAFEPSLAASMANALGDEYIENDLDARLRMTEKATSWLTERMQGLRQKVETSEEALQQFREQEKLVDAQGVQSLATGQLQVTSGNLIAARDARLRAENVYEQIRALKGQPMSRFESIPAVLSHPVVQNLKSIESTAQSKVAELRKRYGPQHPKLIAAIADLNEARINLHARMRTVLKGIEKEFEVAKANEEGMLSAMEQAKQEVQGVNRKQYELDNLDREVEANRELYNMGSTRICVG